MQAMKMTILTLVLTSVLVFSPVLALAQREGEGASALREAELRRAELFGIIRGEEADPQRTVTPREGLSMVADALALSLGARDASFDNQVQATPQEGELKLRELCMALSRAGTRMGVPVRSDLPEPALLSGTIGRSSYFATRDAAYLAPNGKTYENELLYAVAFACGTPSMTTGLNLIDVSTLLNQGLEAGATWELTVAAALRLYEAVPQVDPDADERAQSAIESTPTPQAETPAPEARTPAPQAQTPAPEADSSPTPAPTDATTPNKITWIEVTAPLVNIRAGASLEDQVLSQASQGERYQTFGLTADGWYIIEYEENAIGYITSEYCKVVDVSPTATDAGQVIGTVTVLTNSAFVRAEPANSGTPVYTASRGQSFECLGQEGNGWYQILYGEGSVGYIYHKNCALTWFS